MAFPTKFALDVIFQVEWAIIIMWIEELNMKTIITTLGVAAALSLSIASTVYAGPVDGWVSCNSEYAACLRDGTNMSLATNPSDAISQGSDNTSNWVSCNSSLAQCYQSLN